MNELESQSMKSEAQRMKERKTLEGISKAERKKNQEILTFN